MNAPSTPNANSGQGGAQINEPADPTGNRSGSTALSPSSDHPAAQMQSTEPSLPTFTLPAPIDDARLATWGMRRVSSQRLVLYSDLPAEKLAALPEAVDQLFEHWVAYFLQSGQPQDGQSSPLKLRNALSRWRATGYLMADEALFRKVGLLPEDVGAFPNGQSRVVVQRDPNRTGALRVSRVELWLHDQHDDYYRRHLLLHEATHCFIDSVVGKPDTTWYAEAIAERFATHRLAGTTPGDKRVWEFRTMPRDNDEVPGWGRIPLIRDAVKNKAALSVREVLQTPENRFLETEWYAWCWALATFLDSHPAYRDKFTGLPHRAADQGINEAFAQAFGPHLAEIEEEWQLLVNNLEYGYDVARTAIDFEAGTPLAAAESRDVEIDADRGWQNAGILLKAGRRYQIEAHGRYSLAEKPKTWWCEPQGISFRYYQGKPLGRLIGTIRADDSFSRTRHSDLLQVYDIGAGAILEPPYDGTLYLRVNDAWGELRDNHGQIAARIIAQP